MSDVSNVVEGVSCEPGPKPHPGRFKKGSDPRREKDPHKRRREEKAAAALVPPPVADILGEMRWAYQHPTGCDPTPPQKAMQAYYRNKTAQFLADLRKLEAEALLSCGASTSPTTGGPLPLPTTWDGTGECPTCHRGPAPPIDAGTERALAVLRQCLKEGAG